MSLKPFEYKLAPKIEKWFSKLQVQNLDLAVALLEIFEDELVCNPYPRHEDPKLIKYIKGLKKNNPKCLRVRIYKDRAKGIVEEFRFYYMIVTPHQQADTLAGYVVILEVSGPSDEDKNEAVERLKSLNSVKCIELSEILGLP